VSVPWPAHKDLLALYGELNEERLSKCTVAGTQGLISFVRRTE
jgi:hypothetical protein